MSNPPAGWYPDPTGQPNTIRWWNGKQWTNRTEKEDLSKHSTSAPSEANTTSQSTPSEPLNTQPTQAEWSPESGWTTPTNELPQTTGTTQTAGPQAGGEAAQGEAAEGAGVNAFERARATWDAPAIAPAPPEHWTQRPMPDGPVDEPVQPAPQQNQQDGWTLKLAPAPDEAAGGTTDTAGADHGTGAGSAAAAAAGAGTQESQEWSTVSWTQHPSTGSPERDRDTQPTEEQPQHWATQSGDAARDEPTQIQGVDLAQKDGWVPANDQQSVAPQTSSAQSDQAPQTHQAWGTEPDQEQTQGQQPTGAQSQAHQAWGMQPVDDQQAAAQGPTQSSGQQTSHDQAQSQQSWGPQAGREHAQDQPAWGVQSDDGHAAGQASGAQSGDAAVQGEQGWGVQSDDAQAQGQQGWGVQQENDEPTQVQQAWGMQPDEQQAQSQQSWGSEAGQEQTQGQPAWGVQAGEQQAQGQPVWGIQPGEEQQGWGVQQGAGAGEQAQQGWGVPQAGGEQAQQGWSGQTQGGGQRTEGSGQEQAAANPWQAVDEQVRAGNGWGQGSGDGWGAGQEGAGQESVNNAWGEQQSFGQQTTSEGWGSHGGSGQQGAANAWGGQQTASEGWGGTQGSGQQGVDNAWDAGQGWQVREVEASAGGGRGKGSVKKKGSGGGGSGAKLPLVIGGAVALVLLVVTAILMITSGDDTEAGPDKTTPTNQPTGSQPTNQPTGANSTKPGQSKNPKLHEGARISSDAISFPRRTPPWSDRKRLVPQLLDSSGQYVLLQEKFDGKNDWYADIFVGALGTGSGFNGDPKATAAALSIQVRTSMYGDIPVTFKTVSNGAVKRSDKSGWYFQQTVTANSAKVTARVLTLTVAVFDLGDGTAVAYISDIPTNRPDLRTAESQAYKGINVG